MILSLNLYSLMESYIPQGKCVLQCELYIESGEIYVSWESGVSGSSFESLLYVPMIQKWNKRKASRKLDNNLTLNHETTLTSFLFFLLKISCCGYSLGTQTEAGGTATVG
jgi:hypothetical protein